MNTHRTNQVISSQGQLPPEDMQHIYVMYQTYMKTFHSDGMCDANIPAGAK